MGNRKDYMIKTLHKLYRQDNWINELYNSIGLQLMPVDTQNENNYNNLFFSNLNEAGCKLFEKDLGIKARSGDSLEQRRNRIQSKWLASYWCTLPVIQNLVNTYYGDKVEVKYDGNATLEYNTKLGFNHFDEDFSDMLNAVNEIKPAHFGHVFTFTHNKWQDYFYPRNWNIFSQDTWENRKKSTWDFWCTTYAWSNVLENLWEERLSDTWGSTQPIAKTWSYCLNRTWSEMMTKEVI
jgi:hypothetical protein